MKDLMPKIEYFYNLVRSFWLAILISSVVCGTIAGIIEKISYEPEYQMTQAFTIELKAHPNANKASIIDTQLSKTIPALLSSDTFKDYMAPIIKKSGAKGKFKVTSLETSNIFYLTCVARTNNDAQIIINEIQEHYSDLADLVIGESTMKFLAPPNFSKIPINAPHYTLGVIAGLAVGVLLVCGLFVILALISNTVTSPSSIEDEINTKCLAVIKNVYNKKHSQSNNGTIPFVTDSKAEFEFKKSISTLSAGVHQKCLENGFKSVLITSTISGEGKSTIALNLALDLADKGKKVLLVDYDLRSPSIAKYLGIKDVSGSLSTALKYNAYNSIITKTDMENLYFCGDNEGSSTSFEQISDNSIKDMINSVKNDFDYVIVDTAPVGFLGDAISIGGACDCFMYIVSYNTVSKPNILRSITTLNETNKNMIGFVLNNK